MHLVKGRLHISLCVWTWGFTALYPMATSVKAPGYASEVTPVILESVVPIPAASVPPKSLLYVQMLRLYHKRPESDAPGLCPAV